MKHLIALLTVVGLSITTTFAFDIEKEITAYSMVTRDGKRLVSYKGAEGATTPETSFPIR